MRNSESSVASSLPPSLTASVGSAKLGELLASLMVVRKNFDAFAPDHGRASICHALLAISDYISAIMPQRPDLVHPLRELLYGLKDLDRGTVVPLLEPAEINHRPPNSYSDELLRADAAVLMELKYQAGAERKVAADMVARRLNRLGYRDGGSPITGKRVAAWRDKLSKMAWTKDIAVQRYSFALKALAAKYPNDPASAYKFYLDCFADLDMAKIRKKVPQR